MQLFGSAQLLLPAESLYKARVQPANDNIDETIYEPAANGHHYVVLMAGNSLCERCGHLWAWGDPKPPMCPPEDSDCE